jgi:hypothetical protein
MLTKDIKFIVICNIYAGSAETAPPLGTILGNLGVNTVKFCKDFNDFTSELPIYIKLEVTIFISENKNFSFTTVLGSVGYLISLLKKDVEFGYDQFLVSDLLYLAKFKFNFFPLQKSIPILLSALDSAHLELIDDYIDI